VGYVRLMSLGVLGWGLYSIDLYGLVGQRTVGGGRKVRPQPEKAECLDWLFTGRCTPVRPRGVWCPLEEYRTCRLLRLVLRGSTKDWATGEKPCAVETKIWFAGGTMSFGDSCLLHLSE